MKTLFSTLLIVSALITLSACKSTHKPRVETAPAPAIPEARPHPDTAHHSLEALFLDPEKGTIRLRDTITLPGKGAPQAGEEMIVSLSRRLTVTRATPGMERVENTDLLSSPSFYRVTVPENRTLYLEYEGAMPPDEPGGDGVGEAFTLLSGASGWYPQPEGITLPVSFRLTVWLPDDQTVVSQGSGPYPAPVEESPPNGFHGVTWVENLPQDEIYLVAAPFTLYELGGGPAVSQTFLRTADRALANRYNTATVRYLSLFERLIGPYPYAKFAVVENMAETGWGMPSFTLLGPTVMRLPFIPNTSLPHEIAHNWWGNGVFVDYDTGNWAEGLTSYTADHLLKELQGKGHEYRRDHLQKYADFVRESRDFPLTDFVARTGEASQAVGYGKAMMLFHMLRVQMGDDDFLAGLRAFYREYRYRTAGWHDMEVVFSRVSGRDLAPIFEQWLTRTGAPALRVEKVAATAARRGHLLTGTLVQTQPGDAYTLYVPLAITMRDEKEARREVVKMTQKRQRFSLNVPHRPVRLAVDPEFEIFRALSAEEIPPALSGLFGAEHLVILLPAAAPAPLLDAWQKLAEEWARRHGSAWVLPDSAFATTTDLPDDAAILILGWENSLTESFAEILAASGSIWTDNGVLFPEGTYGREYAMAVATRDPGRKNAPVGWIATDNPKAIPGLARKLPHYGKYGYVAFTGDAPDNVLKGQWPVTGAALSMAVSYDGKTPDAAPAPWPARPPLGHGPAAVR